MSHPTLKMYREACVCLIFWVNIWYPCLPRTHCWRNMQGLQILNPMCRHHSVVHHQVIPCLRTSPKCTGFFCSSYLGHRHWSSAVCTLQCHESINIKYRVLHKLRIGYLIKIPDQWMLEMKTLLNADERHSSLQWHEKNSMRSEKKGMNSASSLHFLHWVAFSVNAAGLQQSSDCKQSTSPQISSSMTLCLSIAHSLLRCNSRMSQWPASASSPLFGGSVECFNCPRQVAGLRYMHRAETITRNSAKDFTVHPCWEKVNYSLQSVIVIIKMTT